MGFDYTKAVELLRAAGLPLDEKQLDELAVQLSRCSSRDEVAALVTAPRSILMGDVAGAALADALARFRPFVLGK